MTIYYLKRLIDDYTYVNNGVNIGYGNYKREGEDVDRK